MKKMGLGRGLDALLPQYEGMDTTVAEIALTEIDPNAEQPRRSFDDEALAGLAQSIRESGVLQPLIVVEHAGRYRIVAGERRFRAARLAGLDTVPCIVRDFSKTMQMEAALIENLQREDLNAIDQAAAIRSLMEQCGYTQEQAAQKLGKSRPVVANTLRLLSLPALVQDMVKEGKLSAGHARVLAGVQDADRQLKLARMAFQNGMSVRALEELAAQADEKPKPAPAKRAGRITLEMQEMENRLSRMLGMRAVLSGTEQKGKITLNYQSAEELERLYQALEQLQ